MIIKYMKNSLIMNDNIVNYCQLFIVLFILIFYLNIYHILSRNSSLLLYSFLGQFYYRLHVFLTCLSYQTTQESFIIFYQLQRSIVLLYLTTLEH